MPLIRINARRDIPYLHQSSQSLWPLLHQASATPGPVIVMIHGFQYQPDHPRNCPHRHILSFEPLAVSRSPVSWPAHLGFGQGASDEGLGVAFGWDASGVLWQAQRRARQAGRALAQVLAYLHRCCPTKPIHIVAHSMGVEPACAALQHLPAGSVCRILSLTGACYRSVAQSALATPAGQTAEFINVTSRENDLFDFLYERLITPPLRGDRALGSGIDACNAVTLQLDCADTLAHLARIGASIAPPTRRICHWSTYMRPGALTFYGDLLRHAHRLPLDLLHRAPPQHDVTRRSRHVARPSRVAPLPFSQKTG
ncbi:alpha/beta hydrolase [Aliisedimentitalea scapharcae]|uniref:Alpha/beta hydrolase n=1 Tax=Aliisedimentitalea scapharcae TaxID=1524259 RepID=A0ABZ2XT90_9RHOB